MMTFLLKAELPFLVVAGIVGQKVAAKLWSLLFKSEVPDTAQENVRVAPLIGAAVLEGTLYKLARMAIDRSLRVAAAKSEGTWIGKTGQGSSRHLVVRSIWPARQGLIWPARQGSIWPARQGPAAGRPTAASEARPYGAGPLQTLASSADAGVFGDLAA